MAWSQLDASFQNCFWSTSTSEHKSFYLMLNVVWMYQTILMITLIKISMHENQWQVLVEKRLLSMLVFQTATLYPGVVSAVCFVLNFFIWGQHSSGAVISLLSLISTNLLTCCCFVSCISTVHTKCCLSNTADTNSSRDFCNNVSCTPSIVSCWIVQAIIFVIANCY